MTRLLGNAVKISHRLAQEVIQEGNVVVDATAGNGYDTLFMAKLVGEDGIVYAFDIQEQALVKSRELLRKNNLDRRVKFLNRGHEELSRFVADSVSAVMFNLGYLPGGDRQIITRPPNTVKGIIQASRILVPGGIITIVAYTGHPGGEEEASKLYEAISSFSPREWDIIMVTFPHKTQSSPLVYALQKRSDFVEG